MGMYMAGSNSSYTIIDLFAGVGGLSLGFTERGYNLVFANDNNKWAAETFKANNKHTMFSTADINDIHPETLLQTLGISDLDVLVAGIPCQSFSMAGYRIREQFKNYDDERNYLFKAFVKFTKIFKPKVLLIENVKGLVSAQGGAIKDMIINELDEIGYKTDWKVLNSADYGAPQIRQRVFFIGNRMDIDNYFPKPTHNSNNYMPVKKFLVDTPLPNHSPRQLTGKVLERVKYVKQGENWKALPASLRTKSCHSGAYGRLHPDLPARTITTRFDTPSVGFVTHPYEDRTLTVREGARIQGFPDDFIFRGPVMEQYKQVGNAVPIFLSRAVAQSVETMLTRSTNKESANVK